MRMRARAALASSPVLLLLLLLVGGCAGAVYKVGDLDAWGVPPPSKPDVYKRWAKSIHFALGDSIWFLYPPSQDSVLQLAPEAFASCDLSRPVARLADGNSFFNLTAPGRAYYASGAPGHCRKGQKLWVDVPMANGTYLQPSATDLAALAPTPAADPPAGTASAPEGASASPAPRAAAAGSVVALCFALQILL
ncbi:unnamed protein product [Miscanthus lutarioriparius]|uniref:Phytocyanin domain-containing protein n=1 Tax=Miscanthus lutarioriparius TaxID=422564 RepID=A0A811M7S9_9POAL|nr:unnamed protein product [Miscanthus lutarioriparius]